VKYLILCVLFSIGCAQPELAPQPKSFTQADIDAAYAKGVSDTKADETLCNGTEPIVNAWCEGYTEAQSHYEAYDTHEDYLRGMYNCIQDSR